MVIRSIWKDIPKSFYSLTSLTFLFFCALCFSLVCFLLLVKAYGQYTYCSLKGQLARLMFTLYILCIVIIQHVHCQFHMHLRALRLLIPNAKYMRLVLKHYFATEAWLGESCISILVWFGFAPTPQN